MIVLGIETSCDETGVALYDSDAGLRADALFSQVEIHAEYGGVVPEIASRDHVRKLLPLINQCLQQAGLDRSDIDGVAYTAGPGLIGALLVGTAIGRSIALALDCPAVAVHHMEGEGAAVVEAVAIHVAEASVEVEAHDVVFRPPFGQPVRIVVVARPQDEGAYFSQSNATQVGAKEIRHGELLLATVAPVADRIEGDHACAIRPVMGGLEVGRVAAPVLFRRLVHPRLRPRAEYEAHGDTGGQNRDG